MKRRIDIFFYILPCPEWLGHQLRKEDLSDVLFPKGYIKGERSNNGASREKEFCQKPFSNKASCKVTDAAAKEIENVNQYFLI